MMTIETKKGNIQMNEPKRDINSNNRTYKIKAAAYFTILGGISVLFGFSRALAKAKQSESKIIMQEGGRRSLLLLDEGSALAMRALGWGTLYACLGTGALCYGIWKISGANTMEEFRLKMGHTLPKLSSDKPASSRTEFESLSDLMGYLADWGKK